MKLVLCVIALFTLQGALAESANPIQKTVQLLTNLQETIIRDAELEEKAYKEYYAWCDDTAHQKDFEIKEATKEKAKLEALISKAASEIDAASSQIEELAKSNSQMETDLNEATDMRTKEHADFQANEKELLEAMDMLERATTILEREANKGTALLQGKSQNEDLQTVLIGLTAIVDAAGFAGDKDKDKLNAFVQSQVDSDDSDDSDSGSIDVVSAPSPAAYENHSEGIVQMMQDLRDKAEAQLQAERQAEAKSQHNYELLKTSLEESMENTNKELDEQKAQKASSTQAKAAAEGELDVTVRDLNDAKDFLASTQEKCMATASDHETTIKGNTEQLDVLAQAKKLLQQTTGDAEGQVYSFVQTSSTSSTKNVALRITGKQVTTVLNQLASNLHSTELSQFASRVSAVIRYGLESGEDPFRKVKGLISDLIARLEKEAAADAQEKAYCDKEMADTEKKEGELQVEVSGLKSKIESASTASATLKGQVKDLQAELADLEKSTRNMDAARAAAKEAYVQLKADLEQGLDGIRGAIKILSDYYSTAAAGDDSGEAFLQTADSDVMQQPQAPTKFQKSTGSANSILGLLEVCENDLAKNLAEAETQESDEVTAYEKFTQESKVTKTMKMKDVEYKTKDFKALDKSIADLSADLETSNSELAAVTEYFAKVKDRCVAKPELYEERKARREAEIKGLQEALAILASPSFLQRRVR